MCKIITVRYVSPDGRRINSSERKQLCHRSDGTNPCLYQEYGEMTELVSSRTPSLIHEDISPVSASAPGTPISTTAHANYDIRAPPSGESSSRRRAQYVPFLDLSRTKSKKKSSNSPSPGHKHRSDYSRSGSSNGDADSIVAIEEDGVIEPLTPTRDGRFAPPPISMRRIRPAPLISQPLPPPPPSGSSLRVPTTPSGPFHRRTYTAPESVRFEIDTEVTDRANAREQLRRENRERERREDDILARQKLRQEAEDRKLAEDLARKEREERAEDEFSRREWERLQEKDKKRREKQDARLEEKSRVTAAEIEQIEKEIRDMKLQAEAREQQKVERRRKAEEAKRKAEEAQRREEEAAQRREEAQRRTQKFKDKERAIERKLQEDLARIRGERQSSNTRQMKEVQDQIDALERELAKQQERRQARERAEQVEQELRHQDVLEEEIREMEDRREFELRAAAALSAHLEPVHYPPNYARQQYIAPPAPAPLRPTTILQRDSPYQSEYFRRLDGERVLEQERSLASARTAGVTLQTAVGLGRRNTVGGGREQDREKRYHFLRKNYPE